MKVRGIAVSYRVPVLMVIAALGETVARLFSGILMAAGFQIH